MAIPLRTACLLSSQFRFRVFSQGKHKLGVRSPIIKEISPEEEKRKILKKRGFLQPKDKAKEDLKFNRKKDNKIKTRENALVFHDEKLAEGDPRFRSNISIAKSRKTRYKDGKIFLEGKRLILDALESGAQCCVMYVTSDVEPVNLPAHHIGKFPIYKVQYKHLKLWSDVVTPSGIAAVFKMPNPGEALIPQKESIPLTLILDNIRDSGNMGTLIRSAAAVGCSKILASIGCADIWEPKVLRSGCGSHFRVPVYNNISWGSMSNYIQEDIQVLLASTMRNDKLESQPSCNFEDMHRLINLTEDDESKGEESESEDDDLEDNESTDMPEDITGMSTEDELLYHKAPLPNNVYHQTSYTGREIALVVGNEAHGLSADAKKFAFENYGQYVSIPLANGVESLNSVVAASVFMFEIRKQLKSSSAKL